MKFSRSRPGASSEPAKMRNRGEGDLLIPSIICLTAVMLLILQGV